MEHIGRQSKSKKANKYSENEIEQGAKKTKGSLMPAGGRKIPRAYRPITVARRPPPLGRHRVPSPGVM